MKKIIFGFFATAMLSATSFANTPTLENEFEVKSENQKECENQETEIDEAFCTITCSVDTGDGITISATAGNWFMSCEKATARCYGKLLEAL
ncbi:hypothetical protein BXU11_05885 [Flavobacterium sp. LM5]|uniref:hypothetical protein n=1 Tax=Flavobacterium sp. LM5 TaxID=1938610 RepID=UPI00099343A6|nr:hypothetical protein [Flavobacterium sp. LM5]OOV29418.1 hypothetical protein BXU11_05885 [Flavobacterium sp. LM5]